GSESSLWSFDGSVFTEIPGPVNPREFVVYDDQLYYSALDDSGDRFLWLLATLADDDADTTDLPPTGADTAALGLGAALLAAGTLTLLIVAARRRTPRA